MSTETLSTAVLIESDGIAVAPDNKEAESVLLDQLIKKIETQAAEMASLREQLQSCEIRLKALENMSPNRISLSCVGKEPIFVAPVWHKTE